jgi:cytochrome bd ubiquinol oxidase subunit II
MSLIILWSSLLVTAILLYVILDGFSLGIGLLFPSAKNEEERDALMNTVGPVWDANQTWLVFGGAVIFAVFPVLYGVLFSALYLPLITFLFGLIFRGVAFEFRANTVRKGYWNKAFFSGSLIAVISQGLGLGGYLSGIKVVDSQFGGNPFDWLNPFAVMVGLALISGYILLGATYLIHKTTGAVQERAYQQATWAAWVMMGFMVLVSIWTPLHDQAIPTRWLSPPRIYFVWTFPLLGVISFVMLRKALTTRRETLPFLCSVLLFLSAYLGLITGLYPYAIPPCVTLEQAAAQKESLLFTLWGTAIVLPVIFGYTAYSYYVFRGKVDIKEGYH